LRLLDEVLFAGSLRKFPGWRYQALRSFPFPDTDGEDSRVGASTNEKSGGDALLGRAVASVLGRNSRRRVGGLELWTGGLGVASGREVFLGRGIASDLGRNGRRRVGGLDDGPWVDCPGVEDITNSVKLDVDVEDLVTEVTLTVAASLKSRRRPRESTWYIDSDCAAIASEFMGRS
jgi:hypothetical protein